MTGEVETITIVGDARGQPLTKSYGIRSGRIVNRSYPNVVEAFAEEVPVIRLTRMKKAGGALLSKSIALDEEGRPSSDGSPCAMTCGTATRVALDWQSPASDLAALILDLGSHEALVLGDHIADADQIEIVKAAQADPAKGLYGRTLDTFTYRRGQPAVALLDFDQKGISESARARLEECGGFEAAIASLIPGYSGLAWVVRASTSAGLRNEETGEVFPANGGQHLYLFAKDGADIQRFLKDLQKRAWLNGLGWILVSSRGALLVRSIVDVTVGSPERLVFEGMPRIEPPLAQDQDARRPAAHEGEFLDTATACPPLTPEEERRYGELVDTAKREKQPEVEIAKEEAAETISKLRGIDLDKARAVVAASTQGELWSWDVLHFDDETIGEVSVADVLADPERFHGETLADPIEGRSYGRGKAQLYWNANNSVIINSFAHGGCKYTACHDADYIERKVEDAGDKAPFVLATLMVHAGRIDAVTCGRLRNLAAKVGKAGKLEVKQLIKDTVREAKGKAAAAARARGGAGTRSGAAKPLRDELILLGGERPNQLRAIEAKLQQPADVVPGAIVGRGQAPAVLRRAVDADKLQAGMQEINLPAGSAYLVPARPEHLQAQLDRLFAFSKVTKDGEQYAVDCPRDLALYTLANASLLPLKFISRTPVLRADGSLLDRPGYDPMTGIYYAPDEPFPPAPIDPTQEDAAVALDRLQQPFRGFPFVTAVDRDAVAGEILTLLTRHLVPRAPAFVHNAAEPGTGKTKLFDTVAIIALGANATLLNADVLDDETELKKVLTTLTLAASPLAVFDNVARGGQITSPGLSNYLTATVYGDRLLGSNTEVKAATCTTIGLTGNAVEIAGDNTRRMIRIDLDAGVERPETREFEFDCEAEVRQDRGELVIAALKILRAHALAGWPAVPDRAALGSFEDWDRLVAGALVFAGGGDIVTLMDKTRSADPERDDLAEVLRMLEAVGATSPMKVGEIISEVNKGKTLEDATPMNFDRPANEWHDLLCRLSRDSRPKSKQIGRYLAKNAGRSAGPLRLIGEYDAHVKVNRYSVKFVENDRGAGIGGFCGVARSPYNVRTEIFDSHRCLCEQTEMEKDSTDQPSRTPQKPHNPAGDETLGSCAHCSAPILPGSGHTAISSGGYLHRACTDAWVRARSEAEEYNRANNPSRDAQP